jgi:REP element-mobilizing transposase RayT
VALLVESVYAQYLPDTASEQMPSQPCSFTPFLARSANALNCMSAHLPNHRVEEASRALLERSGSASRRCGAQSGSGVSPLLQYFDPDAPIAFLSGTLPHWRQDGATYFVTFRLADALPQEKLQQWRTEQNEWLKEHREPHDEATRREYYEKFPQRLQRWLDAGNGSCVLTLREVKQVVDKALRHFEGIRYRLDQFVVAANHVHALVTPVGEHTLSQILHSWKSFTAHEILKVEAASRRLGSTTVWQKESFDHIVRNANSMAKFREYISSHPGAESGLELHRNSGETPQPLW